MSSSSDLAKKAPLPSPGKEGRRRSSYGVDHAPFPTGGSGGFVSTGGDKVVTCSPGREKGLRLSHLTVQIKKDGLRRFAPPPRAGG